MGTDMMLLLACCLLLPLLFLRRHFGRRKSSLPLPPGPRGLPILGVLPSIGELPHATFANMARKYGNIMYVKMGTSGVVVASDPAAAKAFLKTYDAQYANRPAIISAKDIAYNGEDMIFSNYNAKWKLLRRVTTLHLLGSKAMANWAPVRRGELVHLVRSMHESSRLGKPVVVPEALMCVMANIMGQITMSRRVFEAQGEESHQFKNMVLEILTGGGIFNIGDFIPAIAFLDLQGVQAKHKDVHRRFDALISKMLDEHKATAGQRKGNPDFMDLVMASKEAEDGETLTDDNVKGLIFDMFTAGTDTSSIIVEWAIAEMLRNPAIFKRAQEEMDRVIGRGRLLEESDLPNLSYLQAVVKEALRKHPSTPLSLPHFSFEECEVEGYYIPKNTRLLINVWAIQRNPDVWEKPLEFDPDRFLTGKAAKIEPHGSDFELIPFGAGRRICVGKQAGLTFVQYILGILVQAFEWKLDLPEGEEMNMEEARGLVIPRAVPISAFVTPRLEPAAYM